MSLTCAFGGAMTVLMYSLGFTAERGSLHQFALFSIGTLEMFAFLLSFKGV